ncbi:MAG: FliG C-terminal domain-containing protein [Candidatus Binataceae bacterium]|jgi:flagellar motor switch protein FliG
MAFDEEYSGTGLDKAALLMLSLDREVLARVLKHLSSDEVTLITQHYDKQMGGGQPDAGQLLSACREFLDQQHGQNSSGHIRDALTMAFGTKAAGDMFRDDQWRAIAERVEPESLAAFLQGERPQIVAVVLSQLPPRYAAEVLSRLPEDLRAESVDRFCRNERVASQTLDALLRAIEENFANRTTSDTRDQGNGVQRAAAVLNQLESDIAIKIVDRIRAADPSRAGAIEQEMFHFNDLLRIEPKALQMVLSEIKPERLAMALKGIPDELRDGIFGALPDAVITIVKEEMETVGRVPIREVQTARQELVNLALQLDREGKIHIRSTGEEMIA